MATLSSRLKSDGTLLLNGDFDEVTFSTTAPVIKNLWKYTQDFTNAYWLKAGSITVANTSAVAAPDGSSTAQLVTVGGSGLYPYIRVAPGGGVIPCTQGTQYTITVYVKYINQATVVITNEDGWTGGGKTATFNISTGTVVNKGADVATATITSIGSNGWYQLRATYNAIPAGVTFWNPQPVRVGAFDGSNYAGSQVYVWGAQLEVGASPTIYQPIANTGTLVSGAKSKQVSDGIFTSGVFDEVTFNSTTPVFTNMLAYTQAINSVDWANASNTITPNAAIAPDGTLTASRIQGVQATGYSARLNVPVVAGTQYTFSYWIKSTSGGTGTWGINWYDGGHHRATVPITGQWVRQSITFTPPSASQINVYVFDNRENLATINDAYVWGAQLEVGSSPSIYQPIAAANTLVSGGPKRKLSSDGGYYVAGSFDQFTGAPVVDSTLAVWFDPAQSASYLGTGNTVIDLSTTNNNGTLISSPTFNTSGFFELNGLNQSISTTIPGNTYSSTSEFTYECWAQFAGYSNAYAIGTLFGAFDYSGFGLYWETTATTCRFRAYARSTTMVSALGGGLTHIPGTWYQVVMTYSSTSNTFIQYVNGSVAHSTTVITGPQSTNLNNKFVAIGYGAGGDGTPGGGTPGTRFKGSVATARLYNRSLTADEVAQNFNAHRRRYGI